MAPRSVSLDDKYIRDDEPVYLTGTQALVRLPMLQRQRDHDAGLNTAGYVTGYRGSPLGGIDLAMGQAHRFLNQHQIRFQPGVNEELAATAIWGSQQTGLFGDGKYEGVFGLWYGKGPGVDRSGDALRHANLAGTAPYGGVLALAGDDHICKSSTTAHQSDYALMDANIPLLYPADIREVLTFGLYGWAMSRFTGCWIGMKMVAETTDVATSVLIAETLPSLSLPDDVAMPPGGLNIRLPTSPFAQAQALEQERILLEYRLPAVAAFARRNPLDRLEMDGPGRRLGIVTCGKSYLDTRQALDLLGLDQAKARELGISLYKVAQTWPLEPSGIRRFASGLDEILVVEEKRAFIEHQLRQLLYDLPVAQRPRILGKTDETGAILLPAAGELTPEMIARVLAGRLARFHRDPDIETRLARIEAHERSQVGYEPALKRHAYFCSGCPHSSSTKVPAGSRALAGIGCHFMAQWMDRDTATYTQMGAEGATWIGQAPFSNTPHVFQNIGDGTYFHSGLLSIRAAIAAGVTMTFKILFNDAVAMTGGQPLDGQLSPLRIARQLAAEGVARIAVVSEDPSRHDSAALPPGASLHHRDELDLVQRELREIEGVTAIVYDQTCAAEKRRRRKRGQMTDPARRVFINEAVCEGCGDCSRTSNCLSILPVATAFGRKRQIDQSSCNKDFSCLEGFCPSFVTVEGGKLRKPRPVTTAETALPVPTAPALDTPYNILITGIGGTGVVTIGALIGMAAHLEGTACSVMDQTGLAQKGGAVVSHIRLAAHRDQLAAVRLAGGEADLLLGCDLVVSVAPENLSRLDRSRSHAVINSHEVVTGGFTRDPDFDLASDEITSALRQAAGRDRVDFLDATRLATALLGDAIASNCLLLGYAFQKGLLPVSADAILQAIELNGTAVEMNKQAFLWGRRAAIDQAAAEQAAYPADQQTSPVTLAEIVAHRSAHLVAYQNAAYAERYRALVDAVATAEGQKTPALDDLARSVAVNYAKLLAYKDEYEVARLYTDGEFQARLNRQFDGAYKLKLHLAPPLLARPDPQTGHPHKRAFGPWIWPCLRMLAGLRGLRGTAFDPFGRTAERRAERRLIADYELLIEDIIAGLTPDNHAAAVQLAGLPSRIRGFGHVKAEAMKTAAEHQAALLAVFHRPAKTSRAAQ
ncbi:indolepyruvate ferredoxin oxidoreductase family protein [Dongia soli]|uniref:Indolepyruvate ferredoxin oxidoreductase family protein n=1 Tax=Dongia soli TaxID=600628 RepID=A0ABU5EDN1_9PROT|nr:indolepyruvate ferredoxin oxidoreductase family protein [Dongia soli]MDY0884160.1 indolepyruvate ferredoxin oxidoreductase family protein [Dongia soli]